MVNIKLSMGWRVFAAAFAFVLCVFVSFLFFHLRHLYFSTPSYVDRARIRTESYLGNYYGPVQCRANLGKDGEDYVINCKCAKDGSMFEFKARPRTGVFDDAFYLIPENTNAIASQQVGLMIYMDYGAASGG